MRPWRLTADQLVLAVKGLTELVRDLGLVEDGGELSSLEAEAIRDIHSDNPTGEPSRRYLDAIRGLAAKAATPAMTAVITTATNALTDDVGHLVHAIGSAL